MHLLLVRHGEAAAGWGADADPGLSAIGQMQAQELADAVVREQRRPIVTSPLRRCRETAQPLAAAWDVTPVIEPRVGEIEAPDPDLAARAEWLRDLLPRSWHEVDAEVRAWRDDVVSYLTSLTEDTVVFTHFVAINAAIGAATGDDRIVCRRAGNCSRTLLRVEDGRLVLVDEPAEPARVEVL